jgi:hypothetical protein
MTASPFPSLASWLVVAALCLTNFVSAQTESVVDINNDSHHHLLLENDKLRIFAVDLGAHESTPLVRHDHNYLVITLANSEIASWAEGQSGVITYRYDQNDIRFFFGGPARALRNDTPNSYHNLTIEFLNPKVTTLGFEPRAGHWQYGSSAMLPPADPKKAFVDTLDLGEARVRDVQLLPDDEYSEPEKPADELLIPLTDVEFKQGAERIRKSQSEPLWIPAGRQKKLANDATTPARMVVMELK